MDIPIGLIIFLAILFFFVMRSGSLSEGLGDYARFENLWASYNLHNLMQ